MIELKLNSDVENIIKEILKHDKSYESVLDFINKTIYEKINEELEIIEMAKQITEHSN